MKLKTLNDFAVGDEVFFRTDELDTGTIIAKDSRYVYVLFDEDESKGSRSGKACLPGELTNLKDL